MTRRTRLGFLALAAGAVLTLGTAGTALAATTGGGPSGNPTPVSSYPDHHKHVQRHCELVLLTGHAVDNDHQGQDVGSGYAAPNSDQQKGDKERGREQVKVEQLAEVCETGEHLSVFDVTRAFAQETESYAPTPEAAPTPSYTSPAPYAPAS